MATILVVEDSLDTSEGLARLLRSAGHEPIVANDGEQALACLRKSPPAMVILDVMMPRMTGLEVLDYIRHDSELSRVPVVMFSALDVIDVREDALRRGANGFWVKGQFDFRTLRQAVDRHLGIDRTENPDMQDC